MKDEYEVFVSSICLLGGDEEEEKVNEGPTFIPGECCRNKRYSPLCICCLSKRAEWVASLSVGDVVKVSIWARKDGENDSEYARRTIASYREQCLPERCQPRGL
jgi:hypothetical protein